MCSVGVCPILQSSSHLDPFVDTKFTGHFIVNFEMTEKLTIKQNTETLHQPMRKQYFCLLHFAFHETEIKRSLGWGGGGSQQGSGSIQHPCYGPYGLWALLKGQTVASHCQKPSDDMYRILTHRTAHCPKAFYLFPL